MGWIIYWSLMTVLAFALILAGISSWVLLVALLASSAGFGFELGRVLSQ